MDTAHVTYGPGHMFGTAEDETMPGPSGNKVGNLNANVGATLTFRVDGGEDGTTATLFATVSNRASSFKFTDAMKVTLNGTEIQSEAMTTAGVDWAEFTPIELAQIELKPGENVIVFEVVSGDAVKGFDFDNLMLASEETLGWFVG